MIRTNSQLIQGNRQTAHSSSHPVKNMGTATEKTLKGIYRDSLEAKSVISILASTIVLLSRPLPHNKFFTKILQKESSPDRDTKSHI